MVNILDLIAEQKSKNKYVTSKSSAWDIFVKQKGALDAIYHTQGYKEIKEYRGRELVACQDRLRTIKSDDIKGLQAEMALAERFLDFLENINASVLTPLEDEEI